MIGLSNIIYFYSLGAKDDDDDWVVCGFSMFFKNVLKNSTRL